MLIPKKTKYKEKYLLSSIKNNFIDKSTKKYQIKIISINENSNYYRFEINLIRNSSDQFNINISYFTISSYKNYKNFIICCICFIIKTFFDLIFAFKLLKRVYKLNFQYKLWYKYYIKKDFSDYNLYRRRKIKTEFKRKFSKIFNLKTFLCFSDIFIEFFFWALFFNLYLKTKNFQVLHENNIDINFIKKQYEDFEYLINAKLTANFLIIINRFIYVFIILRTSKKISIFSKILTSLQNMVIDAILVFIIFFYFLVFFFILYYIKLGHKYLNFSHVKYLLNFISYLIKLENTKDITDNYDEFVICFLFFPFFIILKFTIISLLISILYITTINTKSNKEKDIDLNLREFLFFSKIIIFDEFRKTSYDEIIENSFENYDYNYKNDFIIKFINNLKYYQNEKNINHWCLLNLKPLLKIKMENKKIKNHFKKIYNNYLYYYQKSQKNIFLVLIENKDFKLSSKILNNLIVFFENYIIFFKFCQKNLENEIKFWDDNNKMFLQSTIKKESIKIINIKKEIQKLEIELNYLIYNK